MTAARKNNYNSNYQTSEQYPWANWALVPAPLAQAPSVHSSQGLPRAYRAFPGRSLGLFSALPGPSFEIRVNLIVSSFFVCLCESCLFFAFFVCLVSCPLFLL